VRYPGNYETYRTLKEQAEAAARAEAQEQAARPERSARAAGAGASVRPERSARAAGAESKGDAPHPPHPHGKRGHR
jgi:ABC transport system ATP-binding/permease protein